MLIYWNDAWKIGNTAIDYDHQMLVNITNQLWDLKQMPRIKNAEVQRIMDQLVSYVKLHFEREEKIFNNSAYPHKQEHIAMHRELSKVVEDIALVYSREPDLLNLDEIMAFLKRWLIDHIAKHDMGYKEYILGTDNTKGGKKRVA